MRLPFELPDATVPSEATAPWRFGLGDWRAVIERTWEQRSADDVSTRAAAIAFSSLLSIPSLLIAVVSLYGLIASPEQIESLVTELRTVAPAAIVEIAEGQIDNLTGQDSGSLGLGLVLGLAGALWAVSGGVGRLRDAIDTVYEEDDTRPWYTKRLAAIAASFGAILFITLSVGLITAVPWAVDQIGLASPVVALVLFARWVLLGGMMVTLLGVLFRYGPDRRAPRWQWISVGSGVVVVAWLVMSYGFSLYTENFARYNETYGSLGAVIIFMTWVYLTAYIVLMAGELNSELEHQTIADTTVDGDQPMGQRGAWVADNDPTTSRSR